MPEVAPTVSAIVLAGGLSQRMGTTNKLHLPIAGTPLLRHSLEILLAANLGEILVVIGYQQKITRELLDGLDVRTVYNKEYKSGQMSSVHCGLAALQQPCDGVIVALADQPALTVADINFLVEAYLDRTGGEVIVPFYQGSRGNPIIISERCRLDILAGKSNFGCRRFIENNPALVQKVEMSNPAVVIDLDTRKQYRNFCNTRQFQQSGNILAQES